MKKLTLVILFLSILNAQSIDDLLEDYAVENDLSNETVQTYSKDTLVKIYTREYLDKLKYRTLKDVLNLHIIRYRENRFGEVDPTNTDPIYYGTSQQLIKIIIDDHEVSLAYLGSSSSIFGDMELDFVNHIEVYKGFSSYEFVTEPSVITLKIYSKTPERDSGSKVGVATDSFGSTSQYAHTASNENDIQFFAYGSNRDIKREQINNNGTIISRDFTRQHAYFKLDHKDQSLSFQYMQTSKDGFLTNSVDATPTKDDIVNDYFQIGYLGKFLEDKSLEVKASYSRSRNEYDFMDDNPFLSFASPTTPLTPTLYVYGENYDRIDSIFNLATKKSFEFKNHDLLLGAYYKQKKVDFDTNKWIISPLANYVPATIIDYDLDNNKLHTQNYYSAYVQDKYYINKENSVLLGLKYNYEDNSTIEDNEYLNYNMSYIYAVENYSFTALYSTGTLDLTPYLVNNSNTTLKNEELELYATEMKYKNDDFSLSYSLEKYISDNAIVMSQTGPVNSSVKNDLIGNSLLFKYDYSEDHSLEVEVWRTDIIGRSLDVETFNQGLYINSINTFDKITVLNEFKAFDTNIKKTNEGWMYNLGLSYQYNKDLSIFTKADNLFDSLTGEFYSTYKNHNEGILSFEKKFTFGLSYTF